MSWGKSNHYCSKSYVMRVNYRISYGVVIWIRSDWLLSGSLNLKILRVIFFPVTLMLIMVWPNVKLDLNRNLYKKCLCLRLLTDHRWALYEIEMKLVFINNKIQILDVAKQKPNKLKTSLTITNFQMVALIIADNYFQNATGGWLCDQTSKLLNGYKEATLSGFKWLWL